MTTEIENANKQFPVLKTTHLKLRPFNLEDAKKVQRMAGSTNVAATTTLIPHPYLDGSLLYV